MDEMYEGYTKDMERVAAAKVALAAEGFESDVLDDEANSLIMCEDMGHGFVEAINKAIDRQGHVDPRKIARAMAIACSSTIKFSLESQTPEKQRQARLAMLCRIRSTIDREIIEASGIEVKAGGVVVMTEATVDDIVGNDANKPAEAPAPSAEG